MGTMPGSSTIDGNAIQRVIEVGSDGVSQSLGSYRIAGEDLTNDIQKVENRSSYTNLSASALVKTGAGRVKGILINSHTTGTLKLWDNTSAATTVLAETMSFAVGERYIPMPDVEFATGLYATIGGTANLTILWK